MRIHNTNLPFRLTFLLLLIFWAEMAFTQTAHENAIELNTVENNYSVTPHIQILPDHKASLKIDDVAKLSYDQGFQTLDSLKYSLNSQVHWVKFDVYNYASQFEEYKLSIAYTDDVRLFTPTPNGSFIEQKSGDLFKLTQRPVKNGQMIFLKMLAPHQVKETLFLRLESSTKISQAFRKEAINSLTIYPEEGYNSRFLNPRFYQAFFYGALFIMAFYNLFIYFSLQSKDYLYYVIYLIGIIIFFSSNAGYFMELFLPDQPRLDLYIRFIATPLLMVFYLQFSQGYLNTKEYSIRTHKFLNILKIIFLISIILMFLFNIWKIGRLVFILGAIISFIAILIVAYREIRRGYSPAKYFMVANILLILGALAFALPRFAGNVQNPLTQYGVQLGVILEVTLFSIGLADRINVARRELEEQKLRQERLELEKEREKQQLIEEKNKELERRVVERTAEVVEQKEEIEKKNKDITASIKYAQRIQNALIGETDDIIQHYQDAFIFFRPKDIVSGDFYWFGRLGNAKVLIAADCTGHGVPGAFMTMMGNAFLNDIIIDKQITEPAQILSQLDEKVKLALHQDNKESKRHDGMDMAVLVIDEGSQEIKFAGAKNPLCRVRNGKIERIKGSSSAIGGYGFGKEKEYEQHNFPIIAGDLYYLFSDGYQDQFGKNGRKFMSKKFRELLLNLSHLPMQRQAIQLEEILSEWVGNTPQTDDILIVGVAV